MKQKTFSHEYEPILDTNNNCSQDTEVDQKLWSRAPSLLTFQNLSSASTQIIPCLFAVFINLLDAVR